MNNIVTTLAPLFIIGSSSFLRVTKDHHEVSDGFENLPDQTSDPHRLIMGENAVTTLVPTFLNGACSFLQL